MAMGNDDCAATDSSMPTAMPTSRDSAIATSIGLVIRLTSRFSFALSRLSELSPYCVR
jgi:hypothetical protein